MDKTALDILTDSISDAGAWQWWYMEDDMLQLEFDDPEYAQEVYDGYRNQTPITPFEGMETLRGAKHLISVKCENVGVIADCDQIKVVSKNASLSEEDIEPLPRKWWEYWEKYWKLRGTVASSNP